MSTFIPPTPAATKSAEHHEEPSEQDSFNHLLFKVLRLTSEQVQDLNDWMIHRGTPNVHEVIVQSFRRPHALEDDLHFIRENKTCYIKAHVMVSLSLMITYIKHLRYSGKAAHFGPFYYIQIDPQDYDEWRISTPEEEIHFQTPSKLGSPATPRSMATSQASESYITLTNFKKGIKRDASAYPILKNERYYNTFIRHFKATAKAQGLNTLMDPNFTPGSDEYEQQLFQEQQDFLYSVLISSLKTDFSEALVKDHEGDAQLILELLHEHHTGNSQYSRSEINRITKYLTNIKLDDTWRGTNESFLMHYNDQLRLLDSLVDSDEKLPDNTRVTFLESAVESVPDLRQVKITDNVLQAQLDSTRPISYRSYFDLLKDAAFHHDQATKRGNKIRHTNVHFSGPNDEDEHQNLSSDDPQVIQQEDVSSKPPEPLSYSVFQSHFQGSSTSNTQKIFLPKPIWEKLSKDQQQMIIDHNRSLPNSGSSSLSTPNKNPSPLPHKPTPQQTAKSQQVHTHQSDQSTADTTKVETTPSDPLLAIVHQSIHTSDDDASDITKVLSAKRSRQIQVCKCYIFQHANHTNNQLVDRGANGGLAGSDMQVIYKTHRKINISGIDNHEVTGLDVVTAATLLNTSLGKVIGIFNEYAYLGKGSSIHSSGQLEWFKTLVDEKSIKVGGTQLITTLDGYSVPLLIRDGLAYATSLGRPTDQDMDTYPHVFFTSSSMVEWESGEVTYEPLTLISKDDPITCAVYAKKHDLLDTTGWKHLKRYAKTSKRLIRAVKQSRIRQVRASARYQHGFQVPKDYNDAMRLDKENGNTHWQDAMDLELTQIHEYKVFKDTGKAQFHNGKVVIPDGFQKIRVHFVYAVKHDGRFKARLVADGHLTKEPVESIYSGVVSLRSLRMVVFLSQLNNLEIWGADVGNAYLEAYTDEKLYIIAGPEFKELQGHLLIMVKALYGTRSGGARWHNRLFDILQELKFKPSKADPDVWMRPEPGGTCYEYIAVYVDDLAIAAKDPQAFCNELKEKYNLKLKGVGPLEYHLGCTYKKDPDGTLAADPRRYVNKILESYERMFNKKPRKSRPPLEGGDHPELDTSELCDDHQTKQFQTLIGQLQWLISLGRFDIAVHVMSLSRFRAQPRKGHLDRAKRIVGYLLFLPDGAIRFRTGEPDFSSLKDQEYDWTRSVYSGACEQIPHDIPKPLGKHVQTTHYVDANLHHDLATGKAVTAVLHFLNQTPIDAYTKRQSTVETATYGSEFVAARTAVDQIIDIRTTLRYLGVPIRDKSYMFGDNRSVVTSSTIPNSTISKRHHLASYHQVREAIAAKFISFHWKDGKSNPADILSKHWEFATVWPLLKPILFWRGETATQLKGSDRIPSTTPGAEPPRDAKDSGSARSHSMHLETSSSNRP